MTHVKTSLYYPQSNSNIERWHKTLKGDCLLVKVPLSFDDSRRIVAAYVEHYNDVHLHSALGYVTPRNKLDGQDQAIFEARDRKLAVARERRKQKRGANAERMGTPTPRPSLDFAAVKSNMTIAAVLTLLGLTPQKTQHRGPCTVHGSTSSRCFNTHLELNIFHCFKCRRRGNALDLWAAATRQLPYDAATDLVPD